MTDPLFDLSGRVAVVTGGLGQLGSVYVDGLRERGMKVAVFDVEGDEPVDVTDRAALEAATGRVVAEWGVPHLLVNNAALDSPPDAPAEEVGPFETYPEASFDRVMDVNVKGTLLCCQMVGGAMAREGRGSIVNVSSVYGLLSPQQDVYEFRRRGGEAFTKPVAYSVSKSAILNLTRYLATYWAKEGVRVNTLTLAGVVRRPARGVPGGVHGARAAGADGRSARGAGRDRLPRFGRVVVHDRRQPRHRRRLVGLVSWSAW